MTDLFQYPDDDYLLLGKVIKAQGLQGEIKIFCYSEQPENFDNYSEITLVRQDGKLSLPLQIEKCRVQGKAVVVKVKEIQDRAAAEEVEGAGVLLLNAHLPNPGQDEFYYHQYDGKEVVDKRDGSILGTVKGLIHNRAQDVLVIEAGDGELLIPITREIVSEDLNKSGQLIVDPPPGLLSINRDGAE